MPKKTGEACEKTGLYQTSCTDKRTQYFVQEDEFPPCPACRQNVNWTPVT